MYIGKIYAQPTGEVPLTGLGSQIPFFRRLIDWLGIKVHAEAREEYKSFVAQYTEEKLTGPQTKNQVELLNSLNDLMLQRIARNRFERQVPKLEMLPSSPEEYQKAIASKAAGVFFGGLGGALLAGVGQVPSAEGENAPVLAAASPVEESERAAVAARADDQKVPEASTQGHAVEQAVVVADGTATETSGKTASAEPTDAMTTVPVPSPASKEAFDKVR